MYHYLQGLVWSTVAFCVPFFYATIQRSPSNNLSFGRLPASSPLNSLLSTPLITAGVRPKRFHSHNDSCVTSCYAKSSLMDSPTHIVTSTQARGRFLFITHSVSELEAVRCKFL